MTDTFTPPTIRPATIADPACCEHDMGTTDINECKKPVTVAVYIEDPNYHETRSWGFCTREHALAETEALWGCGFNFPKEN